MRAPASLLPRLKFLVRHPKDLPQLRPPRRGRPPNYIPLLVAIDEICRRGLSPQEENHDGFVRPLPFKRGRRSAKIAIPESEALLVALADDWGLGAETVYEYLSDVKRFYYPRALGLVTALAQWPISPRFQLDEIRRAASEYQPRHAKNEPLPLAPGGLPFDLHPLVYEPKQRSKSVESRKRRHPQKAERKTMTKSRSQKSR